MNFTKQQYLFGAGLLLAGLFFGWILFSGPDDHEAQPEQLTAEEMDQHIQDSHTNVDGEIIYTCSMHPQVREIEPGNCPICGMELIPVQSSENATTEDDFSMVMSEAAVKLAQIQTTPVIQEIPKKEIELPGRIQVDERSTTAITAHFSGRIINTKVNFTGAEIKKGEVMATIYSPELVSAQRELLEAASQKERNPRLYELARQKFLQWEFSEEQINSIENSGQVERELEIISPVDGFVLSKNITDQQRVDEGAVIFEVADLSSIWVVLEAYEDDLPWIQTGDSITFATQTSGETYEAMVSYIDPTVDPETRTVGIRADMNNPDHQMKPDMLVRGKVHAEMGSEKLLVPASSVLWTGPRSLIYVQDTSADVPRFEVREVVLGVRAGDYYVIEEGVQEGEEIVFHGNFRVDSEFQLADKFSMMNRNPGSGANRTGHEGHNMNSTDSEEESSNSSDIDHSNH